MDDNDDGGRKDDDSDDSEDFDMDQLHDTLLEWTVAMFFHFQKIRLLASRYRCVQTSENCSFSVHIT